MKEIQGKSILVALGFELSGVACSLFYLWYCILLFSPSTRTSYCKYVFPSPASISSQAICWWENYLISFNVEFQYICCLLFFQLKVFSEVKNDQLCMLFLPYISQLVFIELNSIDVKSSPSIVHTAESYPIFKHFTVDMQRTLVRL